MLVMILMGVETIDLVAKEIPKDLRKDVRTII